MKTAGLALFGALLPSAAALAAAPTGAERPLRAGREVVVEVGPEEADLFTPGEAYAADYHILFLNRCEGGETITRGFNDSRSNSSSIIDQTRTFPAYPYGDESWNEVLAQTRLILAPFGVEVTDVDPGDTPHTEIIVCGESFRGDDVLGVAPFGCGLVANAIGYVFAENHLNNPRDIAETVAHEAGHTFSLNHLLDCEDPMTYLGGCGDKYFVDAPLQCAGVSGIDDWEPEECACGGTTQNSHATLLSIFGPAELTPPELEITEPPDGAPVEPGFPVRARVEDPQGVAEVRLAVDGSPVGAVSARPYVFNAPATLGEGEHVVRVEVDDRLGATSSREVTVCIGPDCEGAVEPGPLGAACLDDAECESNLCGVDADGEGLCTRECDADCPEGFLCTPAGDRSVCWPEGDAEPGGGCQAGGGGGPVAVLLLLAIALGARRRARRVDANSLRR